jgi:hypothetical protein
MPQSHQITLFRLWRLSNKALPGKVSGMHRTTRTNRLSTMHCNRCGNDNCFSSLHDTCSLCGSAVTHVNSTLTGTIYSDSLPWESENGSLSPVKALIMTLVHSFSRRKRFFAAVARSKPLIPALLYGLIMGTIGTLATIFWEFASPFSLSSILTDSGIFSDVADPFSPSTLIATPLVLIFQIFFLTIYCHGMLIMTRSKKRPLAATFKTVCYAQGAALFQIVPFAGVFLSFFAGAFLLLDGIHAAHEISRLRTFMSLFLPLIIIISAFAVGTMALLSVLAFSTGSQVDPFSFFRR